MSLSVSSRPTKTVNGFESTFNSVHRPMKYVLNSTKFPVNTFDTGIEVTGVASNTLGITVTTVGVHGYVAKEYVTLKDMSVSAYNGNFKILSVPTTTTFVIGVAYSSSATGEAIPYYNNYFAQIEVYAGLPAYHTFQASKALRLIDTVNIVPDSSGNVDINVAPLLKQDIEFNYDDAIDEPDYNQATACYIKYREVYDEVSGGEVVSTAQAQSTDTLTGCTPAGELVTGGNFTGGYANFDLVSNIVDDLYGGFDAQWVYGTNNMQVTLGAIFENSSEIKQDIDFSSGFTYDLTLTVSQSTANGFLYIYLYDNATGRNQRLTIHSIASGNVSISFTPDNSYDEIHIFAYTFESNVITIDDLSIQASDCTYYIWAINAITEFNHANGGNLATWVANENYQVDSITNSPILFDGFPFFESYIIPNTTIENLFNNGSIAFRVTELDQNGVILSTFDRALKSRSDGIYHRKVHNDIQTTTATKAKLQLIYLPDNLITVADGGNFESTFASWSSFFGYLGLSSQFGASASFANTGTQSFGLKDSGGFLLAAAGTYITYYDQGFSLQPGESYDFSVYFLVDGGGTIFSDVDNSILKVSLGDQAGNATISEGLILYMGNINLSSQGLDEIAYSRDLSIFNNDPPTGELAHEQWIQLSSVFTNNTASPITVKPGIKMSHNKTGNISMSGSPTNTYFMFTDTWVFKGPKIDLSNERTIEINRDCTEQDYHLMWLNNLGGYDFYNFSARKVNTINIEGEEIYRNPENNWDTGFINNPFAHDFIKVRARNRWTVRSKPLTTTEVDAIEQVLYSLKVYKVNGSDTSDLTGVNVVKSSVNKYQDKDKLTILSFDVLETDFRPIQSQ